jgi:hypothetical protein
MLPFVFNARMDGTGVERTATDLASRPAVRRVARAGFVATGVVHLVIAWIAAQLALGGGSGTADQSGALRTLAKTPVGRPLLVVAVVAFTALALWLLVDAVVTADGAADRVKSVGKALVYGALAWTSIRVLMGDGGSSRKQSQSFTADVLRHNGGKVAIVVVGLAVVGIAAFHVVKGATSRFLEDLTRNPGRLAVIAGRLGYIAKGVALAVVGLLFVSAAIRSKPAQAGGLDAALRTLLDQPFGKALLLAVAVGLACYALYSFVRARYGRL